MKIGLVSIELEYRFFVFYEIFIMEMLIIERKNNNTQVKVIPGASTSIEVEVPVIFADNSHSRTRQDSRGVNRDIAVSIVKQALPEILNAVTKNDVTKTPDGKAQFSVADKQSCCVIGCTLEGQKDLKQIVIIRTVFIYDQYHPLDDKITTFFINEDNPSKEWEDAEYYISEYGKTYNQFRAYEKQFDPEHRGEIMKKKRDEMERAWNGKTIDRLGKNYSLARGEANSQDNIAKIKNRMGYPEYDLEKAKKAADDRILTKRGTNGMLRGMDKRRKAAEKKLNDIVKEEIEKHIAKHNPRG